MATKQDTFGFLLITLIFFKEIFLPTEVTGILSLISAIFSWLFVGVLAIFGITILAIVGLILVIGYFMAFFADSPQINVSLKDIKSAP